MGRVLRVFQSQQRLLMLPRLKSRHSPTRVILPALESTKAKDIQAIEAIQRTFTYKITEVQQLNYLERLHELKLHPLQRRRERYIIKYILEDNTAYHAKY